MKTRLPQHFLLATLLSTAAFTILFPLIQHLLMVQLLCISVLLNLITQFLLRVNEKRPYTPDGRWWTAAAEVLSKSRESLERRSLSPGSLIEFFLKAVMASVMWQQMQQAPALSTELLTGFYHLLTKLLTIGGLIIFLVQTMRLIGQPFTSLGSIYSRTLEYGFRALIVLCVVRLSANTVYEQWQRDPQTTTLAALGISIVVWVLQSALRGPQTVYVSSYATGAAAIAGDGWTHASLSTRDRNCIAIHEAGHALMYAACDEERTPQVNMEGSGQALASVKSPNLHQVNTRSELRLDMQVCVAGAAAEQLTQGQITSGSQSDRRKYYAYADELLMGWQEKSEYIYNPATLDERLHNQSVIDGLYEKDFQTVTYFLETNRQLLSELADALKSMEQMDAAHLRPFLRRAILTPGLEVATNALGRSLI